MRKSSFLPRALIVTAGLVIGVPVIVLACFRVAATRRETVPRVAAAPAAGRFVRGADVEMYVQEAGPSSGAPVLLVHGTGAWSEIWRRTIDTLAAAGYHAVAIDMPAAASNVSSKRVPANSTKALSTQRVRLRLGLDSAANLRSGARFGKQAPVFVSYEPMTNESVCCAGAEPVDPPPNFAIGRR